MVNNMKIGGMKKKVGDGNNTSPRDKLLMENRKTKDVSKYIEQSVNVNAFSASDAESKGRAISLEYKDD